MGKPAADLSAVAPASGDFPEVLKTGTTVKNLLWPLGTRSR